MSKAIKQKILKISLAAFAAAGVGFASAYVLLKKKYKGTTEVKDTDEHETKSLSELDTKLIEQLKKDITILSKSPQKADALSQLISNFKQLSAKDATHRESAFESFVWLILQNVEACAADKKSLQKLRIQISKDFDIFVSPLTKSQQGPIIIKADGNSSVADLIKQVIQGQSESLIKKRAYELEAALTQLLWACSYAKAHPEATLDTLREAYANTYENALAKSWSTPFSGLAPKGSEVKGGEWHVRRVLAEALMSSVFPIHPQADFQVNAQDGNVAIELTLLPHTALLGRTSDISKNSKHAKIEARFKKQQQASRYTLDMGLWLTKLAFAASDSVKHVWLIVKEYKSANNNELTLLSVDFDRYRFEQLKAPSANTNYQELLHGFAADVRLLEGRLHAISPTISLNDARFYPPRRREPISLQVKPLTEAAQENLGARHAAELSIEEADTRLYIANQIVSRFIDASDDHAVEKNVRAILDLTSKVSDPEIESAAKRTISSIIDGTVELSAQEIGRNFVEGDALSQAVISARSDMHEANYLAAIQKIEPPLTDIDAKHNFDDSPSMEWRFFSDFASRALYNRLNANLDKVVMLVPDAYFEAHFSLAQAYAFTGDVQKSLEHAARLYELAPMDAIAALSYASVLRQAQEPNRAAELIEQVLPYAHNALSLGLLYFQLGLATWELGELKLAEASMVLALKLVRPTPPDMLAAITQLKQEIATANLVDDVQPGVIDSDALMSHMQFPLRSLPSLREAKAVLNEAGIPEAPSRHTLDHLMDGLIASTDEELFDVARSFGRSLYSFSHDPILAHIVSSLESN